MHNYFTHNTLQIARTMDPDTLEVSGSVGTQPDTFIASDWTNHGNAYEVKAKADAEFQKLLPNKSDNKKVYLSLIQSGNSELTARQISGYKGK